MDSFWKTYHAYLRSYLPQWQYDPSGGEPESAVLLAAAELIAGSRTLFRRLPQKYELEFLRGWALEPLCADPPQVFAALSAPEHTTVKKGTEFYLSGDGSRLWRTAEDVQAGPTGAADHFLTGAGKVIPLPSPAPGRPLRLFDLQAEGVPGPELQFSHPNAFSSTRGCLAQLSLPDAPPQLLDLLAEQALVRWSLVLSSQELIPLAPPARKGSLLSFTLPPAPEATALQAKLPTGQSVEEAIGQVKLRTERLNQPPGLIWDGETPCAGARWLPFGETPELWRTCFLSCPDVLCLRGAKITVSFTLSVKTHQELLPGMEQQPAYRPIMLRLPPPPPPVRTVQASQVLWEYWNGRFWLPIPGTEAHTGCFAALEEGAARIEVQFLWPEDAAPCEVGGQPALWLRWRIGRVDNSGWLPRRCLAPEITDLRFSARLEDAPAALFVRPQLEECFHPISSPRAALFPRLLPPEAGWWLGFQRPPAQSLQMYLSLLGRVPGGELTAWEAVDATRERPLTLEDGTQGLAHSGILCVGGIQGKMSVRFGLYRWWLCLRDGSGRLAQSRQFPSLEELTCGAVRLQAVDGDRCRKGERLSPLRGGPLRAAALTDAFGGSPREDRTALLERSRAARHHLGRCVSALDVDQIICGRLRDVLRTRCLREGNVMRVAVLMRDAQYHEAAFALRREEIRRLLEQDSVLPSLGLKIEVQEPVFYPVNAMVWLRSGEDTCAESIRRSVCEVLDRFLHPTAGYFHGGGWQIGALPSDTEVGSCLQTSLPHTDIVKILLTATTPEGREFRCDQAADPFSLPRPSTHTVHVV